MTAFAVKDKAISTSINPSTQSTLSEVERARDGVCGKEDPATKGQEENTLHKDAINLPDFFLR